MLEEIEESVNLFIKIVYKNNRYEQLIIFILIFRNANTNDDEKY